MFSLRPILGLTAFLLTATLPFFVQAENHSPMDWQRRFQDIPLLVANYPERVHHSGVVLKETVDKKGVRVMYHYYNDTNKTFWVNITVSNQKNKTSELSIVKGIGGPNYNALSTGHRSTAAFFRNLNRDKEELMSVLPGEKKQVIFQKIKPKMVVSGLVEVLKKNHTPVDVKLEIIEEDYVQFSDIIPESPIRTPYTYAKIDSGLINQSIVFNTKDKLKEIPLGHEPFITDHKKSIVVKGNYGAIYSMSVKLINDTSFYKNIGLYISRISGIARSTLLINDKVIVSKGFQTTSKGPEQLTTFLLPPHSTQTHSVLTLPEAGGFYPVNLILRHIPYQQQIAYDAR